MPDTTTPYRQESVLNWLYDNFGYHTTKGIAVGLNVSTDAVRSALSRLEKQSFVGYINDKREGRKWALTVAAIYRIQKQRESVSGPSSAVLDDQGLFV
jgi:Mn-dependent DtxR family transcriptional regulator